MSTQPTTEEVRKAALKAALKKMPKYLVMVAKDPTLPPAAENTLHLEFNWFVHMVWTLLWSHRDAILAERYQVITTKR